MHLLLQFSIIFLLCLVGQGISLILPFAFPSSIISMILLLILLIMKWVHMDMIKDLSEFLLSNMAFFFIPAGVAILERYDLLKGNLFLLLIICIITTILTFYATLYTVTFVMHLLTKGGNRK